MEAACRSVQPEQAAEATVRTRATRHSCGLQARTGSQSNSAYQGTRHSSTALSMLSGFLLASTVRATPARQGSPHQRGCYRGNDQTCWATPPSIGNGTWPQHASVTGYQGIKQMGHPPPADHEALRKASKQRPAAVLQRAMPRTMSKWMA